MLKEQKIHYIPGVEFKVIFSGRRTLGISVLPDSSVIVRVPYMTSPKTINRIVQQKADWIIKHRDSYRNKQQESPSKRYINGEIHLFRGIESVLKIENPLSKTICFNGGTIELNLPDMYDSTAVKRLLYTGYKNEAQKLYPEILKKVLIKYDDQNFKPTGLIIRTMKRRWGSCSNSGVITLSTELIKLSDIYIEYVILHELCHLKHHNHGVRYYKLLSELFPDWKTVRRELRKHIVS